MSSYAQLLSSAPGSCADIRRELAALLGLKVSGTTYNALWKNLELHLGHDGAVSFVDDFVDYRQKRKTLEKVMGKKSKTLAMAMLTDDRIRLEKAARTLIKKQLKDSPAPPARKVRKKNPTIVTSDYLKGPTAPLATRSLYTRPFWRQRTTKPLLSEVDQAGWKNTLRTIFRNIGSTWTLGWDSD